MSNISTNERPKYVGRTSRWSLGIDNHVITIIIASIFAIAFFAAFIVGMVSPDTFTNIFGSEGTAKMVKFVMLGLFVVCLAVIFVAYIGALAKISGQMDNGRDGFANNARSLTLDRPNHNEMRFIYFRVYDDRVAVTDFTGWREWVYLLAGVYQIRVRQTWFGKSFNYGDVILRSSGTAGEIEFPGIKDPHAFKAFLEKRISACGTSIGAILPTGINAASPNRAPTTKK